MDMSRAATKVLLSELQRALLSSASAKVLYDTSDTEQCGSLSDKSVQRVVGRPGTSRPTCVILRHRGAYRGEAE
jgi:hypothetical protein